MSNPDEYNGWKNRETWAMAMHLSNDQTTYERSIEIVTAHPGAAAEDELRDWVAYAVEAVYHEPDRATRWARMLAADVGSVWRVDWHAIAESFREDVEQ